MEASRSPPEGDRMLIHQHVYTALGLADYAKRVVAASKETVEDSNEVIRITRKVAHFAAMKARTRIFWWRGTDPFKVKRFRVITRNCQDSTKVLSSLIWLAKFAIKEALEAADNANSVATEILNTRERDQLSELERVEATERLVNEKVKMHNTQFYLLVNAMEECLAASDLEVWDVDTDIWWNIEVCIVAPVSLGFMVLARYIYRYLQKIKEPTHYKFLGLRISSRIFMPWSGIVYYLLSTIYSCLAEYPEEVEWRILQLRKIKDFKRRLERYFAYSGYSNPSFEETKHQYL